MDVYVLHLDHGTVGLFKTKDDAVDQMKAGLLLNPKRDPLDYSIIRWTLNDSTSGVELKI